MSLGTVLLLLALVLAVVAAFVEAHTPRLLAAAVVLLAIAVWLGVEPLALS